MNDKISSFTLFLIIVAVAAARPVDAELSPAPCDSLISLSLPQTTVDSAVIIAAGDFVAPPFEGPPREADAVEKLYGSLPAFCRVVAHARPTPDSEIRIEVWLPLESWSGEFRGTGNGGFAGAVMHRPLAVGVKRGFAVAGTNTGHEASPVDAQWALGHPEKVVDFGWRAIHEMTTTAKAVVEAFYGRPPRYSYFSGCFNGGRQALMEAQRFPGDYDGIVAGAPAAAWSRLMVKSVWNAQALNVDSASWIPPAKIQMLARAVNEACDAHDGLADGILADPRDCDFDPETLLCEEGDEDDCLTPPQVAALKAIYRGPQRSDGTSIYPGIPPGAEGGSGGWINWITGPEPRRTGSVFSREYYRNMVFGESDWLYRTADIDELLEAGRAATGGELDATDPDLGPFADRGGKLILYHGWNDPAISAHATVDYYEAVEQTVSEDETEGFVRLYMVPGVQHCGGGPGPQNFHGALDRAVERWVRTGDAPSRIETDRTADDGAGDPVPSWPLCPYSQRAVYTGGDPAEPSNFECRDEDADSTDEDADTVHVAPPTGETNSDRENVQAAFDAVQPGGTVLFAPGTYLLGAGARLTVPDVTVLGHPEGTVLRGCDPEAFAPDAPQVEIAFGCTGLYVQAERQTIRGLTFEYTWHGIVVGPFPASAEELAALVEGGEPPPAYPAGGQRIEGNTFRATPNGLRVRGTGNELSVVRDNDFIDVFHAIGIYGAPLHFLDNRVTVTEPGSVPFSGHTASAIIVSPARTDCAGHVVAGNRIEGYPDPIYVLVGRGETCRGVEIRDNTIHAARVRLPEAGPYFEPTGEDSTLVGAPVTLMNTMEPIPGVPESDTKGVLEDILVQGNQIVGAEGLGILIQGVSRSRIAGNTITGIERRSPFPGIMWDGFEQQWEDANGSAIWLSPGSDENEVVGNVFEDIAADAVVIEGDGNQVQLADPADAVRDLGRSNRVRYTTRPGDAVMRGGLTRPSIQLRPDLLPHLLHPTLSLGVDGRHGRVPEQPGSESLEVGR